MENTAPASHMIQCQAQKCKFSVFIRVSDYDCKVSLECGFLIYLFFLFFHAELNSCISLLIQEDFGV